MMIISVMNSITQSINVNLKSRFTSTKLGSRVGQAVACEQSRNKQREFEQYRVASVGQSIRNMTDSMMMMMMMMIVYWQPVNETWRGIRKWKGKVKTVFIAATGRHENV
jgi:hypothetical protein